MVFFGLNGQGKTNALESIYALANLCPLQGTRSADMINWDLEQTSLRAFVETEGVVKTLDARWGPGGRKTSLDDHMSRDLDDYFDALRAVAFAPYDDGIVTGEPKRRRRWIDRAAFAIAPSHLHLVKTFRKTHQQAVALLKEDRPDRAVLDAYLERLCETSSMLSHQRSQALLAVRSQAANQYRQISGAAETLELVYRCQADGDTKEARKSSFMSLCKERRADMLRRRRVLVGAHMDDVQILLDGQEARRFGSRGQVRSTVLSLKLAELAAASRGDDVPLFLLDDLSSELDSARTARLVVALVALQAQVVLTTTDPVSLSLALREQTVRWFHVEKGQVSECSSENLKQSFDLYKSQ